MKKSEVSPRVVRRKGKLWLRLLIVLISIPIVVICLVIHSLMLGQVINYMDNNYYLWDDGHIEDSRGFGAIAYDKDFTPDDHNAAIGLVVGKKMYGPEGASAGALIGRLGGGPLSFTADAFVSTLRVVPGGSYLFDYLTTYYLARHPVCSPELLGQVLSPVLRPLGAFEGFVKQFDHSLPVDRRPQNLPGTDKPYEPYVEDEPSAPSDYKPIADLSASLSNASSNIEKEACRPLCEKGYLLPSATDFEWVPDATSGHYHYIGSATKVIIPQRINGSSVSCYRMFADTSVTHVASTVAVSDLRQMFSGSTMGFLDLSKLLIADDADLTDMFKASKIGTGYGSSDSVTALLNESYKNSESSIKNVFVTMPK